MNSTKEILLGIFLFSGAEKEAVELVDTTPVTYKKGEVIYNETDYKRALGVVISGTVQAVSAKNTSAILSVFKAGSVFGAAAIFSAEEGYCSRLIAASDCKVVFIEESTLRTLFKKYPICAVNYITYLSSKIRFLNGKIAIFTSNDALSRVYSYLSANCDESGNLKPKITMSSLAKVLCIGRTSLYRSLDALEEQNLIIVNDRKIKVIL